jgi:peptidoglycan/xylan/chitin deacetylase (PgdA/CDA1 family)
VSGEEWALGLIPAAVAGAGLWWSLRYGAPPTDFVPILMFHKVDPKWEWGGTRQDPKSFARKMRFLHKSGFRTVPLTGYLDHLTAGTQPPAGSFILTFDDAYTGLLEHALPVLGELDYTATIFAPSAKLGKENDWELRFGAKFRHMTGEELRQAAKLGHEIGSHGRRHIPLVGLDDARLRDELEGSKRELEDLLGQEVRTISYPYGRADARVKLATRLAGYSGACGSYPGRRTIIVDRYELRRLGVYSIDTKRTVAVKLRGRPLWWWATLDLEMRLINRFSIFSQLWRRVSPE